MRNNNFGDSRKACSDCFYAGAISRPISHGFSGVFSETLCISERCKFEMAHLWFFDSEHHL